MGSTNLGKKLQTVKPITNKERIKIRNYTKKLYLELNDSGQKLNSNGEISKNLFKRFQIKFSSHSIGDWAKEEGWDILLQSAKNLGVEKIHNDRMKADEKIKEALSDEIADIYQTESRKYNGSSKLILKVLDNLVKNDDMDEIKSMLPALINIANNAFSNLQELKGAGGTDKYDDIMAAFRQI